MTFKIIITNDDGPPSAHSPFIVPFLTTLRKLYDWHPSVFIPLCQQSWIGKAHQINGTVGVSYYSPLTKCITEKKEHEDSWVLLSGPPASCVNIALHHFVEKNDIEVVISGPNFGRNSSSTFMTCSGTIGAAIEASHCGKKAIAVSFAFMREEGFDDDDVHIACEISWKIIHKLLQNWPDDVDLFNINVPVFKNMPTELEVHISSIHQNSYAGLFKPKDTEKGREFYFQPEPHRLFGTSPLEGTDAWCLKNKHVSVTPLLASYALAKTNFRL